MNTDTLVAISCYSGDQGRVESALDLYLHHQCPVITLSPTDAPANIQHARVGNRQAGKNCYDGQQCLDRYDAYLRILLEYPQNYFLFNDSDSFCLSPELPRRLYQEDVFWSFIHPEGRPHASPYPKVAFQPPLFLSRGAIERLLSVDRSKVPCHPVTPYPDWYWVALACECGLAYKTHPDGVSFPGWNGGGANSVVGGFHSDANYRGADQMVREVLSGKIFIHAVRHADVVQRLRVARQDYLAGLTVPPVRAT